MMFAYGKTLNAAPGTVQNLNVLSPSPNSLLVRWDAPEDLRRLGLEYTVTFTGGVSENTGDTFQYITGLTQNTLYNVSVTARNSLGTSPPRQASGTTRLDVPQAPTGVKLSSTNPSSITITWNDPSAVTHSVTNYIVRMRCNEVEYIDNITVPMRQAIFNISNNGSFAWCSAQVQGVNELGAGQLSAVGLVTIPHNTPNMPRCFMAEDVDEDVLFSFTITDAVSLSNLVVNYAVRSDVIVLNETLNLHVYQKNGIMVDFNLLSRGTMYTFSLRLCNAHGCSEECVLSFSISSVSILLYAKWTMFIVTDNYNPIYMYMYTLHNYTAAKCNTVT